MDKLFDNIKKGVSIAVNEAEKLTKVVTAKTTNIVDTTKLNFALSDTESKINKLYAKIGEMVYTKHTQGTEFDGEIGSICAEIDAFKEEASNIKEQIASLKNTTACPKCGQFNDRSNDYCSKCGEKMSADETYSEEDMVIEVTDLPEE